MAIKLDQAIGFENRRLGRSVPMDRAQFFIANQYSLHAISTKIDAHWDMIDSVRPSDVITR